MGNSYNVSGSRPARFRGRAVPNERSGKGVSQSSPKTMRKRRVRRNKRLRHLKKLKRDWKIRK
jgi:hypothetical protein